MDYQWYPGHMTKARRMMQENIALIDLLIELTDARAPQSGRNPDIDTLAKGKSRIIVLNKADLADSSATKQWRAYYEEQGFLTADIDSRKGSGVKQLKPLIDRACAEKIERNRKRGIVNRPVRAMIAGIPNVGKSTFINSFAGRSAAKTGDKPGVTKGKQWIRLNKNVELLDTPGILWPKFDDQDVGRRLALVGSIRDEIINTSDLAMWLIGYLEQTYPRALKDRYQLSGQNDAVPEPAMDLSVSDGGIIQDQKNSGSGNEIVPSLHADSQTQECLKILGEIALHRRCLKSGAEADLEKAAKLLIDDFRAGRLGNITLEKV